jgi:hypothetical protein
MFCQRLVHAAKSVYDRHLAIAEYNFVAIKKPFALQIPVAVDTDEAAIAGHSEGLDDCPCAAYQVHKHRPRPLLNRDPIRIARLF